MQALFENPKPQRGPALAIALFAALCTSATVGAQSAAAGTGEASAAPAEAGARRGTMNIQPGIDTTDRFSGGWKIATSEAAPWVDKPGMIEESEVKRLVGANVEISKKRIDGPAPLACRMPHYEVKRYSAEGLFEGGLGEIADAKISADQIATKLGFKARPIPSLVTGCEAEIEYHAIDNDHLIFALNNSLYRLTRTRAAPAASKP